MSYCVHCGVSLDPSERVCPLCGTEVVNPRQPFDPRARRPYPSRLDPITARVNRQFIATLISIGLLFPAILTVVIDLTYSGTLDWSLIVAGALTMIWVWVCPSLLMKKPTFLKVVIPAIIALIFFLLLIDIVYLAFGWFWQLAMPVVVLSGALVVIVGTGISKRRLRGFAIPAAILIATGLMVVGIEIITERHAYGRFMISWSLFILIPCLALAGVMLSIARRRKIHDEIRKRLHL